MSYYFKRDPFGGGLEPAREVKHQRMVFETSYYFKNDAKSGNELFSRIAGIKEVKKISIKDGIVSIHYKTSNEIIISGYILMMFDTENHLLTEVTGDDCKAQKFNKVTFKKYYSFDCDNERYSLALAAGVINKIINCFEDIGLGGHYVIPF